MTMNHSEISSFIWNVCDDIIRGLFKNHEWGQLILPFTVLRRFDCVLDKHKDTVIDLYEEYKSKVDDPAPIILNEIKTTFFNHSKYDLRRLKQDPANVFTNYQNYLGGYSDNVQQIIENFELEKPIKRLVDEDRFFLFVERFSEIDLSPERVSNHMMGQIFEELIRRSAEKDTGGEHYTPRDVIRLLTAMVFTVDEEHLQGEGKIRSIYDPCCGTGGMLTGSKEFLHSNINNKLKLRLLGQELNPETYAVCKSDMMIIGDDPENIRQGSTLSKDRFKGERFDYMLTNPPYGEDWKADKSYVLNEKENPNGRFSAGTPNIGDGQLLFVQHMISKMEEKGSRIGIVLNASPFFNGDAGSGESEIRKWIITNDWLECLVALPDQLFFNTGISTYLWILNNKKSEERKGKVQLIDGSLFYTKMKKSLGDKRKELSESGREKILETYLANEENDFCQIHPNDFFGYTRVEVHRPLIEDGLVVTNKKGEPKKDTSKKDYERIPLGEDIDKYFEREVKPYRPDAWMDRSKDRIGYEINFRKYFYEYKPLRSLEEISSELLELDKETEAIINELVF